MESVPVPLTGGGHSLFIGSPSEGIPMTTVPRIKQSIVSEHPGIGLLGRVRNPAYTGANRCYPCTAVNLGLVAVAAAGTWFLWPPLGAAVALAGVVTTALWGYVVPGTPALTKRYMPDRILAWFDKAPTGDALDGIDAEAYLRDAGVIVDGDDGDIHVSEVTFERVAAGVAAFANDDERLAAALARTIGLDPDEVTVSSSGVGYGARVGIQPAGRWESRVALATELAADEVFGRLIGGWRALPADTRGALLGAFRLALDRCPACDGEVSLGSDTVESCCRAYEVVVATCTGCDARLFELDAALLEEPTEETLA